MKNLKEILRKHGLKSTGNRVSILSLFHEASYAISYSDIESGIETKLDKVTIYRTLKSFLEAGLIHEVYDNGSQVKYALCHTDSCCSKHNHESHAHFKCTTCSHTFCLEDVVVPAVKLPKGYTSKNYSLLVEGVCESCN